MIKHKTKSYIFGVLDNYDDRQNWDNINYKLLIEQTKKTKHIKGKVRRKKGLILKT